MQITITVRDEASAELLDKLNSLSDSYLSVNQLGEMKDITSPKSVGIEVRRDGKVIWVNVEGICVLRCSDVQNVNVVDNRPMPAHSLVEGD